jgi:hypothetical protein
MIPVLIGLSRRLKSSLMLMFISVVLLVQPVNGIDAVLGLEHDLYSNTQILIAHTATAKQYLE